MSDKKVLFLFTEAFPFGMGEPFLENEITYLAEAFDVIIIVSNAHKGKVRTLPSNVIVKYFPYHLNFFEKANALWGMWSKIYKNELLVLLKGYSLIPTRTSINTILTSIYKGRKLKRRILRWTKEYMLPKDKIFLYSYWMNDMALGCAMAKQKNSNLNFICRAHGWDLYFERHKPPYLPFRKVISEVADKVLFVSNHGKDYFITKNKIEKTSNLDVSYLGTKACCIKPYQRDNAVFRILSCSSVIALKQTDKIAEAVALISPSYNVEWTHIGSGDLFKLLEEKVNKLSKGKAHIKFILKGPLNNAGVIDYYENNDIDLFINASKFEGLPVSMMEAFSFGVPVIASDVGGVSEIVDNGINGFLFPAESEASKIASILETIITMPDETYKNLRENAFKKWEKSFNADNNYRDFLSFLE